MTDRDTIMLVLRPEKTGDFATDPNRGLRAILKRLLRSYGWRCLEIRSANGTPSPTDTEGEQCDR